MNDQNAELFEAELRQLRPAPPPAALLKRLSTLASQEPSPAERPASARPKGNGVSVCRRTPLSEACGGIATLHGPKVGTPVPGVRQQRAPAARTRTDAPGRASLSAAGAFWQQARLWLPATAAAAAAITLLAWRWSAPPARPQPSVAVAPPLPTLRADGIEFGQQLLAAYDAVAQMPGGEPVRFRCREWMDEVVLRDSARGIVIEQRVPRLEVVPVCFETD